jgi:xanthine/CO dehydrogenase XdhC/CoxF family maturation factor
METAYDWHRQGQKVALLTLVAVRGSAYRRPGAKMVMASSGRMRGTLSGGCLEGDLFLHAEQVMKSQEPMIAHYDLTEDEMWGLGIGCKGQVDIWIEPIDLDEPFWSAWTKTLQHDQVMIWGGQLPQGLRYFAGENQEWTERHGREVNLKPAAVSAVASTGSEGELWWDVMSPPARLVLAGAGHDARPVARLAQEAGFEVIVLDPRESINTEEHFPHATHIVKSASEVDPASVAENFWVIMNHHQRRDEEALILASASRPKFVGVLGPRSRTEEMMGNSGVLADGIPLHSPVGLDVGAEGPEEVAISIVSELMAARKGRTGGSLHGQERIHR